MYACVRCGLLCLALVCGSGSTSAQEAKWQSLLEKVDPAEQTVAGKWTKTAVGLRVEASEGARLSLPFSPRGEYDFRTTFTRRQGVHSIALIFPHGKGQATFEVDAWGRHLAGIQNVAGKTIRDNPTRRTGMELKNGQRYTMTVEVRRDQVLALLDDRVVASQRGDGSDLSILDVWKIPQRGNIGLGAWASETVFHAVEVRPLGGAAAPLTPVPAPVVKSGTGKRVLIVIANYHFFYREYGDPRAELERAGFKVTVAAGRKVPCRPHPGSGQGADGGVVQPDIAVADARATDYDAILFSGGWGASAYQYAFPGRYAEQAYNGERTVKTAVNRLIGEFVAQDKYVCALCNGVSVLAWARVDGQSPLRGKQVCAPTREAPAGIYNGRAAQPSCRWHPEANGAVLSPAGSIGRPGTAEDDVLVDGKIVTGEDDITAREMGRRIVGLLSAK